MFLCSKCHDVTAHPEMFRSNGQCEGCGKPALCIDCHYPSCQAPKKKGK